MTAARDRARVQPSLPGVAADEDEETPEERREAHRTIEWWERMQAALVACVVENGGYDKVAAKLDKLLSRIGHTCSGTTLRAALKDRERNYFRGEWYPWFIARSAAVRSLYDELLAAELGDASPEEMLVAVREELDEHGRTGDAIWAGAKKRAAARRRGRPPP